MQSELVDVADIFADADAARYLADSVDDDDDDDQEPNEHRGRNAGGEDESVAQRDRHLFGDDLLQEALLARTSIVRLPDGDIHLCGRHCRLGVPDRDGNSICPHTGLIVARVCEQRTDNSTGRSTWSVDPDLHQSTHGHWKCKRNVTKASASAFIVAQSIAKDVLPPPIAPPARKPVSKRGALCVGEANPASGSAPKRSRTSRGNVGTMQQHMVFAEEASSIFGKLVLKKCVSTAKSCTLKPELLNFETLYYASLRKYLKERVVQGVPPTADDIHNIALAVQVILKSQQSAVTIRANGSRNSNPVFRTLVSKLIVAAWMAARDTPYFKNTKRSGDSFRPFAIGCMYAFKRGLSLHDGTVVVPQCKELAAAMPTARMVAADPLLKSMHSASHRGLCTLHRCIASAPLDEVKRLFAPVVEIAARI